MRHRNIPIARLPERSKSARDRALYVLADMRRDPSLALTRAARNRRIDPRSVHTQLPSAFLKDSSGRIRPKPSSQRTKTLYIPTATPGRSAPVVTRKRSERLLLGEWLAALNAAARGDWSRMRKFPKRQIIGGVRLATGPRAVQRILNALAEKDEPFEGLYRAIGRGKA